MTVPANLALLAINAILAVILPALARAESIHDLAAAGNVDRALALLSEDPALVAARDANGRTPLHMATRGGHLAVVDALVSAGADVNAVDRDGTPPLHSAAYRGHEATLRFLLAYGAQPDARDNRGNTALVYALYASRRANVARLLEAGADVNLNDSFGSPPLHSAVRLGFREEASALLSRGALVDATGYNGSTAVHLAIENGQRDILNLLLAHGASTTITDAAGDTPLHKAAMHGDPDMVAMLLGQPHDLEAKNKLGRTPLHQAAAAGYAAIVAQLLEKGAAREAKDADKSVPLELALRHRHWQAGKALGQPPSTVVPPLAPRVRPQAVTAWYLGNSGWAVRVGSKLLVFDYWNYDAPPDEPSLANGRLVSEELKDLTLYFFVSHVHPDHYDPSVLQIARSGNAKLIFGWDAGVEGAVEFSGRQESRRIDGLEVRQISDGESSAFLVRVDGVSVFHAGDYIGGDKYAKAYEWLAGDAGVDLAFVDLSETYRDKRLASLVMLKPRLAFPMHARRMEYLNRVAAEALGPDFPETRFRVALDRGDHFDCPRRPR